MGMQGAATVPSLSEALAAAALTSQAATAPARPPALAAAAAPSRVPAHAAAALTAAALAAAALATATLAIAALAAAFASPVVAAVHASADVVHQHVRRLRAESRVPGRWTRLAHGLVRRRGSVRVRHGLRRLRRSLHVPAVSVSAAAVATATLVAAPTHGMRRLVRTRPQRRVPGRRSGLADRLVRRARAVRLRYRLH